MPCTITLDEKSFDELIQWIEVRKLNMRPDYRSHFEAMVGTKPRGYERVLAEATHLIKTGKWDQ